MPNSLHSPSCLYWLHPPRKLCDVMGMQTTHHFMQRVVVLKDQTNKQAHEDSAHLACESAGSIRTVAALTREGDCLKLYSESLEEPLRRSNRTAIGSSALFSFTQSLVFFVIALIFGMEPSSCPSGKLALSNSSLVSWCVFIGRINFCVLT
jgi:hypothetical protein